MTKKILPSTTLADLVNTPDFLKQMQASAEISRENECESGFCSYADEDYAGISVNEAVKCKKESASSDLAEHKHTPEKGYHIPMFFYRLVHVHFHPPNWNIHPSPGDINDCLRGRESNWQLRQSAGVERDIFKNGQYQGSEVAYINPVSIIGLSKNKAKTEFLVYQGCREKPVSNYLFFDYVADYFKKKQGCEIEGIIMATVPGAMPFWGETTQEIADFLNRTKFFKAECASISYGKISKDDLKKLGGFKMLETKRYT